MSTTTAPRTPSRTCPLYRNLTRYESRDEAMPPEREAEYRAAGARPRRCRHRSGCGGWHVTFRKVVPSFSVLAEPERRAA
jgi:hypothetical protein